MDSKLEEFVLELHQIGGLKFGDFKMKVGINSPVYFDLRVIVSHPHLMDRLSTLTTNILKESNLKYDHVCGVPYTALPIATLVSVKLSRPMLVRRKEAKDYGTRKMIEGQFKKDDECIIIEDVVTSGSSILDTVKDLKKEGLRVKHAFVVLDREQGGIQNLTEEGIQMHVLVTLSRVLEILSKHNRITNDVVTSVHSYISKTQIKPDGKFRFEGNGVTSNRLGQSFKSRAEATKNMTAAKLLGIMNDKKSMLCVAADVTSSAKLLDLASKVGPYICVFKTHVDAINDFDEATAQKLNVIARDQNFLIMEDRKFSDIGNTVALQYSKIHPWAVLITAHSLTGESILTGLKSALPENCDRGCFLVAELSCKDSLISKDYTQATVKMAEAHPDFVVGLVCQSPDLIKSPDLIQLTPGVRAESKSDSLGQVYNSPEFAVLQKGCDIAVVGRGITESEDPASTAENYRDRLWKAYMQRISELDEI